MIWAVVVGLIAGVLAKLVMPGKDPGGWIITILLGIAGSVVANLLGTAVGWYGDGFIRMALKTKSPILPVAVVGAEETYMSIAKSDVIARLIGFPYFPITPTFPLLGPLGVIPMPTKWYIDIGKPIPMDGHGPKADQNLMLVSQLTDQVRAVVQKMINERLAQRKSVFRG